MVFSLVDNLVHLVLKIVFKWQPYSIMKCMVYVHMLIKHMIQYLEIHLWAALTYSKISTSLL